MSIEIESPFSKTGTVEHRSPGLERGPIERLHGEPLLRQVLRLSLVFASAALAEGWHAAQALEGEPCILGMAVA